MKISVVRDLPEETWRSFVAEHPDGNVFHTPEMFQVFARTKGHEPALWAAVDSCGHVLALLTPVKVNVLGGFLSNFTSRSVMYGGVLCQPDEVGLKALSLLLTTYNQEVVSDTLFTEIRNLVDTASIQSGLQQSGYTFEEHTNFLIDLDLPVESVWGNLSKSARKTIRRALKNNQLVIEEVTDCSKLEDWYGALEKTYRNIQIPLADISLFEAVLDILYPQAMVQFLLGRVEDTCVAASVALLYKKVIYGWYRGFDRDYATFVPNDLMVWQVLEWGAKGDYCVFDFGGAGKPNEDYGPRKFKAKFGGTLVNYGRNTCIHAPMRLSVSQKGYQVIRRFL